MPVTWVADGSDKLDDLWSQLVGVQPTPPGAVVLGAGVLALLLVIGPRLWYRLRHVVTIAHEGGHALVSVLSGRRLSGIRLHSDTSGVTVSRGRPTGPGMVFTALAGYPAPALLGLLAAWLLSAGRITVLLWLGVVLLATTLLLIRNLFGGFLVVLLGLVVLGVSWFAPSEVQAAFAYFLAWFLLFGAVRPLFELQGMRRRGRARTSDVDQLAQLTRVPGLVWVLLIGAVNLGCLGGGGYLLTADQIAAALAAA